MSSKIDCSIRKAEMEERGDDVGGREGRETRQLDWDTSIMPLSLLLVLQAAASVPPHQNLVCLQQFVISERLLAAHPPQKTTNSLGHDGIWGWGGGERLIGDGKERN